MGSFFGKGKNKDNKEQEQAPVVAPRPSRRAVVAGGAPAGDKGVRSNRAPTQRVASPEKPPGEASVFAKGKSSGSDLPSSSDSDQLLLPSGNSPARPDTKAPIRESLAPQFSGSIAAATRVTGPSRTGDAALIEFLVNKAHLITADQADLIKGKAQRENLPLDAAAVALNIITEDQLVNALTQECWVPHLKVDKYEIRKKALDTISLEDAQRFSVFPVDKLGGLLTLAMVNPLDVQTAESLALKTGLDIKKVVATRSEIQQGIEKYYGGKVEARDTSISFVADAAQETKSVTQLLGNVRVSDATPAEKAVPELKVTPEIQDIDDLLTADDIIAPAIIESKPVSEEIPLIVPAGEVFEIVDSPLIDNSPLEMRSPPAASAPPVVAPPPPAIPLPPVTGRITAPEFDFDDTDAIAPSIKPATEIRRAPPQKPPVVSLPQIQQPLQPPVDSQSPAPRAPIARPSTASVSRPVSGAVRPGTGTQNRLAKPAASRGTTGRVANPKLISLIPVLEEEFQHAITHGKAHVFEKWIGLQTRNRIINAIPIEAEFDTLLASIYEAD